MNRGLLRIIAVTAMLVDHVGAVFDLGIEYRLIGRAALPAFLLLLVDGMQRTKDLSSYGLRLATFGVVAQPVYIACGFGPGPNIFFTLAVIVGICANPKLFFLASAIMLAELATGQKSCEYGAPVIICAAAAAIGEQKHWPHWIALGCFLSHCWPVFTWGGAIFGISAVAWLFLLVHYSKCTQIRIPFAERGIGWYWFYPGHLAVLALSQWWSLQWNLLRDAPIMVGLVEHLSGVAK